MRTMATTTKAARPSLIAGERQRLLLFVERDADRAISSVVP
jgi:hypothetical protein